MIVSCSGGARMMEGTLSLMQMAKVSAALARLDRRGCPSSRCSRTPPRAASPPATRCWATSTSPSPALIGFAGPRVIEQTIRQKLPEGFQRGEFLLEHGMLDLVVDRRELKATLARPCASWAPRLGRAARRRRQGGAAPLSAGGGEAFRRRASSFPSTTSGQPRPVTGQTPALETFGIKLGLERSGRLCEALGHPERSFISLHADGTNGKGSVTAMAHAALVASVLARRATSRHISPTSRSGSSSGRRP